MKASIPLLYEEPFPVSESSATTILATFFAVSKGMYSKLRCAPTSTQHIQVANSIALHAMLKRGVYALIVPELIISGAHIAVFILRFSKCRIFAEKTKALARNAYTSTEWCVLQEEEDPARNVRNRKPILVPN